MNKSPWKSSAIAVAATLALGLYASDASALALGRVTVQSALGEPFRAEIDIPDINAEEASSLRAAVASGAAFRAAGMELTPAIASVNITLQRRADGRYYLRLTSDRAVNEPFLDLVLEANWASGRVVRDYTMLFDPPNLRQTAPVMTAQAPALPRSAPAAAALAARAQAPAATPAVPLERASRQPATRPDAAPTVAGLAAAGEGQRITVRPGETAGRIAAANKPPAISLDQMLLAMLRTNPDAFVSGNINRLRAGAVLDLPSAEQAAATEAGEARQLLVAQSRDFNEFRRRLAEGAPTATLAAADRQASGKLQAQVEEKAGASGTPDKLTLSKGAVQGKAATESVARERAAQDAAARMAELNKNIADLNKLTAGSTVAAGAAQPAAGGAGTGTGSGAVAPGVGPAVATAALPAPTTSTTPPAAATPAAPAVPATPAAAGTTAPVVAAAAAAATGAEPATPGAPAASPEGGAIASAEPAPPVAAAEPAPPATPAPAPAAAPAAVETSLVDDLLQNPMMHVAAGGLLTLLLGFVGFRALRRRKSTQAESSFLESRTEPDSFFGASGGQRIDTAEGATAVGSSMVYSASQLDAAGDVDPVAEADVYLAYGRDLQAEEILKEALRTTPERVAIHSKLLEIYAKRKEVAPFNKAAEEAFSLTRGQGPEWDHICALGHEIDPENPLYTGAGTPPAAGSSAVPPAAVGAAAVTPAAIAAVPDNAGSGSGTTAVPPGLDLDLDLDLSPGAVAGTPVPALVDHPLDDAAEAYDAPVSARLSPAEPTPEADGHAISFELPSPVATPAPAAAKAAEAPAAAAKSDPGMIEFDLSALSLDLDRPASFDKGDIDTAPAGLTVRAPSADAASDGFDLENSDDPLATKLALAEEFSAIGDPDGARSLAEEVRNEASGALKGRAERFLAELS